MVNRSQMQFALITYIEEARLAPSEIKPYLLRWTNYYKESPFKVLPGIDRSFARVRQAIHYPKTESGASLLLVVKH